MLLSSNVWQQSRPLRTAIPHVWTHACLNPVPSFPTRSATIRFFFSHFYERENWLHRLQVFPLRFGIGWRHEARPTCRTVQLLDMFRSMLFQRRIQFGTGPTTHYLPWVAQTRGHQRNIFSFNDVRKEITIHFLFNTVRTPKRLIAIISTQRIWWSILPDSSEYLFHQIHLGLMARSWMTE